MSQTNPAGISPTAHYTSYVWVQHGLSHPALGTPRGRLMYAGLGWFHLLGHLAFGGNTLEEGLLQRHLMIDHRLTQAIEAGRVRQVVEIASGLTGRGVRFMERFRGMGLVYVEADLPQMAATKRRILDENGLRGEGHHVVSVDALQDDGPESLSAVVAPLLDPTAGVAVITEGLLQYYPKDDVKGMWARFARFMSPFCCGLYLADSRLSGEIRETALIKAFRWGLKTYAGGQAGLQFVDRPEITAALEDSGFGDVAIHHPRDMGDVAEMPPVRGDLSPLIIEGWTRPLAQGG